MAVGVQILGPNLDLEAGGIGGGCEGEEVSMVTAKARRLIGKRETHHQMHIRRWSRDSAH